MDWPVEIAPGEPEPLYFDADGRISKNALELAGAEPEVDRAAVTSVLQFGAIVPPLSPWRGVNRFVPGFRYSSPTEYTPVPLDVPRDIQGLDLDGQADAVERLVDSILTDFLDGGPDPIVLFSGGVDSALLACRLAALGRTDSLLLNCGYGDDDPEAEFAEKMAVHLGMPYQRIAFEPGDSCACLQAPGRVFSQPFTDITVPEMWQIASDVAGRAEGTRRAVLDGTGVLVGTKTDSWERLLRVPRPLRVAVASAHGVSVLSRPEKIDRPLRTTRRSVTMPPIAAVMGENALAGIIYEPNQAQSLYAALDEWLVGIAGPTLRRQGRAGLSGFISAMVMTPKTSDILRGHGVRVSFPFVTARGIALGVGAIDAWRSKENKAPLKRSLTRQLPSEWVYRPKSTFSDPQGRAFRDPAFVEYLREAARPGGPIAHALHSRRIDEVCAMLEAGRLPTSQVRKCIWGIAFADRWYRTALEQVPAAPAHPAADA